MTTRDCNPPKDFNLVQMENDPEKDSEEDKECEPPSIHPTQQWKITDLIAAAAVKHNIDSKRMIELTNDENGHIEFAKMCEGFDNMPKKKQLCIAMMCGVILAKFKEATEVEEVSPLKPAFVCVGRYFMKHDDTSTICYVAKFKRGCPVVVTAKWYYDHLGDVRDEANWRANAVGFIVDIVYASTEDDEITGRFVPRTLIDFAKTDEEED